MSDSVEPPEDSCPDNRLERIEDFLARYDLRPRNPELIALALTHRSYAFEHNEIPDNERLEFLGDAVLGALAADYLYQQHPDENEGELSKKKAFSSAASSWAGALPLDLAPLVLLGRGEESTGGRDRSSIIGSVLEALIGALYYETPFDALRRFVWEEVLAPGAKALESRAHLDFKSRLQEILQKHGRPLPLYRKIKEEGPAHNKHFIVEVCVENQALGRGEGARIKTAENQAAREAFHVLKSEPSALK